MSSSSSSSFNDSWRDAVSRSKSRRSSSSAASSKSTTSTALQTKAKKADTAVAADTADATAAPPSYATTSAKPTVATTHQAQPQANQRFSQYLARFNMSPRQAVAAAISSPRRGAKSLSNNVFFAIGGSGGSSSSRGGGGGSSSGGGDGGVNGDDGKAGGTRLPRRQRDRERKAEGSSTPPPPPPPLLPLTGPSALAATINSTLTVTTGRAAGERAAGESITTSDSSFTSDSLSGSGGGGGGGDGGGFGVATGDDGDVTPPPGHSLPWEHPPASPPPACMPNLHQSSGSEGPSGSEDDEGFGMGGGSIEYRKFLLRRSTSSAGAKETAARVSTPGRRGLGTGSDNVERKKFLLRRASSSAGENDTAGGSSSPPVRGTAAGLPSTSASRRPANKGKAGAKACRGGVGAGRHARAIADERDSGVVLGLQAVAGEGRQGEGTAPAPAPGGGRGGGRAAKLLPRPALGSDVGVDTVWTGVLPGATYRGGLRETSEADDRWLGQGGAATHGRSHKACPPPDGCGALPARGGDATAGAAEISVSRAGAPALASRIAGVDGTGLVSAIAERGGAGGEGG
ncbi:unnamed protein product [Ectocarpus sp. 6 AP-2014]